MIWPFRHHHDNDPPPRCNRDDERDRDAARERDAEDALQRARIAKQLVIGNRLPVHDLAERITRNAAEQQREAWVNHLSELVSHDLREDGR